MSISFIWNAFYPSVYLNIQIIVTHTHIFATRSTFLDDYSNHKYLDVIMISIFSLILIDRWRLVIFSIRFWDLFLHFNFINNMNSFFSIILIFFVWTMRLSFCLIWLWLRLLKWIDVSGFEWILCLFHKEKLYMRIRLTDGWDGALWIIGSSAIV